MSFSSITQYDKQFDKLFANISHKGFSCGYFSILTAFDFFDGKPNDKSNYEKCVMKGMNLAKKYKTYGGIGFEELVCMTNLKANNINATNVDLIVENIIGINQMLPPDCKKYATIFLKNEKYFIVCFDGKKYFVRDCHMDTQYDFNELDKIKDHLYNMYQFDKKIVIDGLDFSEYSSIEFIVITDKFTSRLISKNVDVLKDDIFDIPDEYIYSSSDIKKMKSINVHNKIETSKFVKCEYEIKKSDMIEFD